jgi:hypothetical protein
MLDFDDNKNQGLTILPQMKLPVPPRYELIYQKMNEIIKEYGIEQNGPIKTIETVHRKFSKKMRELFVNEINEIIKDLDISFDYTKQQNMQHIRNKFEKRSPKEESKFIKMVTDAQPFVSFFDDKLILKNNYAKLVAMKTKGKSSVSGSYQAGFNLNVSPSYSIELLKFLEGGMNKKNKPFVQPEFKFSSETAVTGRTSNPNQIIEDGIPEFCIFLNEFLPNLGANAHTEHLIMETKKEFEIKSEPSFLNFDSKNSPQFAIYKALYLTKYNQGVDKIMEVNILLYVIRNI